MTSPAAPHYEAFPPRSPFQDHAHLPPMPRRLPEPKGRGSSKILTVLGILAGALALLVGVVQVSNAYKRWFSNTPEIARVEMARGFQSGRATDVTTTFSASDPVWHCVGTFVCLPPGTKVKAEWVFENGSDQLLGESELTAEQRSKTVADFHLTLHRRPSAGKYRVDVYVNGKRERSCSFQVQGQSGRGE